MLEFDHIVENEPALPSDDVDMSACAGVEAAISSKSPGLPLPGTGSRRLHLAAIFLSIVVFIGSTVYVALTFQWEPIFRTLKEVSFVQVMGYGGASIMLYWMIRALRWHLLLKRTGTTVPFFDLYMCTAVSLSFSIFTPLQSGEMLKVELLKKYGMIGRFSGYGSFLVERALDLATVVAIAGISLLTALNIYRSYALFLIFGSLIFAALGFYVLYKMRLAGKAQQLLDAINQSAGNLWGLMSAALITCVSWASVVLSWYILLHCGWVQIGFFNTMALMSIVTLVSILSLIPGGLGISEAGSSQVLIWLGFASTAAQTGTLMLRSYSIIAIVFGFAHLVLWKIVRQLRNRRLSAAR